MFKILYKNKIIFQSQNENYFLTILSIISNGYDGYISHGYYQYSINKLRSFLSTLNIDYDSYPYRVESFVYIDYFEEHPKLDKNFINQEISIFLARYPRFILYFFSNFLAPYINPFSDSELLSIDLKDFFFRDYHFLYLLMYSIRESFFLIRSRKYFNRPISDIMEYLESLITFTYFEFVNNKDVPIFHRLAFFTIYHLYMNYKLLINVINYINIIIGKVYNLSIIQYIIKHKFYIYIQSYIESKPWLKNSILTIPFTILLYLGYNKEFGIALILITCYIGLRFFKLFLKWVPNIFESLYVHTLNHKLWYLLELPITLVMYLVSIVIIGLILQMVGDYVIGENVMFLTIQTFALIRPKITAKIMSIVNWIKINIFDIKY
jgi:hypothetical protein